MEDKTIYWITQFWSFVGVAFGVYLGGVAAKRIATTLGYEKRPEEQQPILYRLWVATLRSHPFIVGCLCGLVPGIPAPEWVPDSWPARMLWYGIAGAVSGQLYGAVKDAWAQIPALFRAVLSKRFGVSLPPPATSPSDPAPAPAPAPADVSAGDSKDEGDSKDDNA